MAIAPGQPIEIFPDASGKFISNSEGIVFTSELFGVSNVNILKRFPYFDSKCSEALKLDAGEREILLNLFGIINHELMMPDSSMRDKILRLYVEAVLMHCNRCYERQFLESLTRKGDILDTFIRNIDMYFGQGRAISDGIPSPTIFAAMQCLTRGHFRDVIVAASGRTPSSFIQDKMMHLAMSRLEGTYETISEIAYSLGFQNANHFSRFFKRCCSVSPSVYRKRLTSHKS